ncbi:flagellin [mine drainage metagenome]|uniref:Flagellin n=1 Tax=mine drainage metagenome TaxID=410659 RepID=A0A1J5Q1U3_9ZZZZ
MSSILTNSSAMVALQSLQSINDQLNTVQNQISTGKSVGSASDNAAVWAISTQMNSDVTGFTGITNSLSLGTSTLSVASQAASSVTDLLTQMKAKIVAAQDGNADRTSLNNDVSALKQQIGQVVGAAQFNGVNLVDGSQGASINILSALDRNASGAISAAFISVTNNDLSTGGYTAKAVFDVTNGTGVSASGDTAGFTLDGTAGGGSTTTGTIQIDNPTTALAAGDQVSVAIGGKNATYTVTAADAAATSTADMVAVGLKNAIDQLGIAGLTVNYDNSTNAGTLSFSNTGANDLTVNAQFKNAGSGGLAAMSSIDVSNAAGATAALSTIESLMNTAISATASFGSSSAQITSQATFVSKLTDTLKTGIGSLVDANMEAASAKLQALQVQQQLGTQALSIANKSPQNLLTLFR